MKRDGATTSLWQQGMPDYTPLRQATQTDFDVIIVGGGITGLTTALRLQEAGRRCAVLEAHTLCYGTTGGTTAHLNTFLDTDYSQIEQDFDEAASKTVAAACAAALNLYRENVERFRIDCGYAVKDGYVYAQEESQLQELNDMLEAARRAGVAVEETDRIPLKTNFIRALRYPGQAQVHPSRYVFALAKAFEEAGGAILLHTPVTGHAAKDGRQEVETGKGTFTCGHLVFATHIPQGINLLHFRCAPYRSYALALKLKSGDYPDGHAYDMYDPYHYHRTQEIDGQQYVIVGGEDHKTAHETNTDKCFANLEAYARKVYDIEEVSARWSSQYFEPSDGLAYIGHLPGNAEEVLVASGYGGNGMTYSHISALILSDLILKGEHPWAELFRPGRVKPVAGFANFIKENADVVAQFVGKRLSYESLSSLAELAPGDAKLVKWEGRHLALYKDEGGKLHALNPVCTHAKCIVDWNSAEKSWDCPCHGARYSVDGEVITGPARKALERVELT